MIQVSTLSKQWIKINKEEIRGRHLVIVTYLSRFEGVIHLPRDGALVKLLLLRAGIESNPGPMENSWLKTLVVYAITISVLINLLVPMVNARPWQIDVDVSNFEEFVNGTYEWYWTKDNRKCRSCPPGTYLKATCKAGSTDINSECHACPYGRYNNAHGIAALCRQWSRDCIKKFQHKVAEGTHMQDITCECMEGYYPRHISDPACYPQKNCTLLGLKWLKMGTPLMDAVCEDPPTTTPLTTTSIFSDNNSSVLDEVTDIIVSPKSTSAPTVFRKTPTFSPPGYLGIISTVALVALVLIIICIGLGIWRHLKRKKTTEAREEPSPEEQGQPHEMSPLAEDDDVEQGVHEVDDRISREGEASDLGSQKILKGEKLPPQDQEETNEWTPLAEGDDVEQDLQGAENREENAGEVIALKSQNSPKAGEKPTFQAKEEPNELIPLNEGDDVEEGIQEEDNGEKSAEEASAAASQNNPEGHKGLAANPNRTDYTETFNIKKLWNTMGFPLGVRQNIPRQDVHIAIIDSGTHTHFVTDRQSFPDGTLNCTDLVQQTGTIDILDKQDHGIGVLGIIAGQCNRVPNEPDFRGVAPCAKVTMYKVTRTGQAEDCVDMDALERAFISINSNNEIDVVNISLGTKTATAWTHTMKMELDKMCRNKVVICAASNLGHTATNTIFYPGKFGNVITVGCHDNLGHASKITPSGQQLDFLAPGDDILMPSTRHNGWHRQSGSSFAAPFISGYVLLVLKRALDLAANDVDADAENWRQKLRRTDVMKEFLIKNTRQPHSSTTGYGIVRPQDQLCNINRFKADLHECLDTAN